MKLLQLFENKQASMVRSLLQVHFYGLNTLNKIQEYCSSAHKTLKTNPMGTVLWPLIVDQFYLDHEKHVSYLST